MSTKLIALTEVQVPVEGKLTAVPPGQPLIIADAETVEFLLAAESVRSPNEVELKTLFAVPVPEQTHDPVGQPDLAKLTKDELIATAAELGLTVDPKLTKPELIAAIEAHNDELL